MSYTYRREVPTVELPNCLYLSAIPLVPYSMLIIFYHMRKTEEPYHEKGVMFFQQVDKQRVQAHLVQRLQRLGYQVTLQPLPAA